MDKYYTPKAEEFFIGYEYEFFTSSKWVKTKVYPDSSGLDLTPTIREYKTVKDENPKIRVKFLDKEDIINEGWVHENDNVFIKEHIYKDEDDEFTGFHYKLYLHKNNCITIEKLNINAYTGKTYYDLYEGNQNHIVKNIKCKSINEFRKIIEWTYR